MTNRRLSYAFAIAKTKLPSELKCCYCERKIEYPLLRTIEHIIPKSKGGSDRPENLDNCCNECNAWRGNKDFTEWLHEIEPFVLNGWDYKTYTNQQLARILININGRK